MSSPYDDLLRRIMGAEPLVIREQTGVLMDELFESQSAALATVFPHIIASKSESTIMLFSIIHGLLLRLACTEATVAALKQIDSPAMRIISEDSLSLIQERAEGVGTYVAQFWENWARENGLS